MKKYVIIIGLLLTTISWGLVLKANGK